MNLASLCTLLLLLLFPCISRALELTENDGGRSVSVPVGETISITLAGNPTTGYTWELADVDRTVLMPDPEPTFVPDSSLIGAGGRYTFRIFALKSGTSAVKLVYRRSWEKGVPPLRVFDLAVTVLPEARMTTATYRSVDGKTVAASFDLDRNLVTVTLPDGRRLTLPAAPSASGARYSDGRETFWEHQGCGRFFTGDTLIFEGTVSERVRQGKTMEKNAAPGYSTQIVHLPQPRLDSGTSVEKALLGRRSVREYRDEPLTLAEIGQLLWAAQGVTSPDGLRTAPSAGALYPLELYVVAGNVRGLAPGIYRYRPQTHTLAPMLAGDRRGELCAAALHQEAIKTAPASLVLSAVVARTTGKYGKRGVRYVYMDHGHAAENVYLQAVALDLGTVLIGAFDDDGVRRGVSLSPEEEPLSIMPVGRTRIGDRSEMMETGMHE